MEEEEEEEEEEKDRERRVELFLSVTSYCFVLWAQLGRGRRPCSGGGKDASNAAYKIL